MKKVKKGGEISKNFHRLVRGLLKMPTEMQIIAAQDQVLAVRAIKDHIYGMSIPATCRLYGDTPEYIDHLLNGCLSIAAMLYKQRHDAVAKIYSLGSL